MEVQEIICLWVDDVRLPPLDCYYNNCHVRWLWATSVGDAKNIIKRREEVGTPFVFISVDHDSGKYFSDGGDYIKLLDWLEETGRNYPIRIHSQNVVGVQNMRAIIQRNGWKEIR